MDNLSINRLWLVSIDVPLWVSGLGDSISDWRTLLVLIDKVKSPSMQLLYRKELQELGSVSPDKYWVIASKLSKKSTVNYPSCNMDRQIKSVPDIAMGISDEKQIKELQFQLAYIYSRQSAKPRLILATQRLNSPTLEIKLHNGECRKIYVCGVSADNIQKRIDGLMPVLKQDKHFMFPRNIGKGKVASTFKAYDRNKPQLASELLDTAFLMYEGENWPAKELWIWDEQNSCFVQFMHSGNFQYHGHDETNTGNIPSEVLDAYGKR